MPKNKIGRHMMSKLKLFSGPVHEHQAQAPVPLEAIDGRPTAAGAIFAPPKVRKPRKARTKPTGTSTKAAALPSPADVATTAPVAGPGPEETAPPAVETGTSPAE